MLGVHKSRENVLLYTWCTWQLEQARSEMQQLEEVVATQTRLREEVERGRDEAAAKLKMTVDELRELEEAVATQVIADRV